MMLVTLMCVYITFWRPTYEIGITDVARHEFGNQTTTARVAVAPLLIRTTAHTCGQYCQRYYLWLFGLVVRATPDIPITSVSYNKAGQAARRQSQAYR